MLGKKLCFLFQIASFLLATIVLFASFAYAYDVEFIGIQNRNFSDGSSFNRASFMVVPIDVVVPVENISLRDPDEMGITGTWKRYLFDELLGGYSPDLGVFTYGSVETRNYYRMNFSPDTNPLKLGIYTFNIDGNDHTASVTSIVDLPHVNSDTFKKWYGFDPKYGENVTKFYWNIPDYTGLDQNTLSFRFDFEYYFNSTFLGGIYVQMPSYINHVVIPDSVLHNEGLPATYTQIRAHVLLQTNDSNIRSYSLSLDPDNIPAVKVNLQDSIAVLQIIAGIPPTVPILLSGDVNGDNKIGLEEGIHALQVVAGLYNLPPELNPIGNKSVDGNSTLSFTILAIDPDGDNLTYSASNLPGGANFDPNTRMFSWIPTYAQSGDYSVTFTVTDMFDAADSETITISVIDSTALEVWEGNLNGGQGSLDTTLKSVRTGDKGDTCSET